MTEDAGAKLSEETLVGTRAMRQRKKRKWDEPAEFLVASGKLLPGAIPMGFASTLGISGFFPASKPITMNTIISSVTQNAITQKLSQPKVQDELIAREIVINDTEPTIRYKLTKRQTQEEIQRSTGAVVITRGKFRPPNALPDGEKPLYLHISAGSHLKEMAERIIAVDRAASMVEEMLRQGQTLSSATSPYYSSNTVGQVIQPSSICLYLGFELDSSHNIAARIRGPNDQYINHIINETGASVVLRGIGSGNSDVSYAEAQQPLHLCLSSTNSKSLEAARNLAENLLDTISSECGISRASPSKLYSAVPPPQQVITGIVSSSNMEGFSTSTTVAVPFVSSSLSSGIMNCTSMPSTGSYVSPSMTGGTFYSGYGGIYPQATPLQQVALALKQAPASTTISHGNALPKTTLNLNVDAEKRPAQKRKFQELPDASKVLLGFYKNSGSECFNKPGLGDSADDTTKISLPSLPEKLTLLPPSPQPSQKLMPPPPPKFPSTINHKCDVIAMPPPNLPSSASIRGTETASLETPSESLLKLVEYEEEEEEDMAVFTTPSSPEESCRSNVIRSDGGPKPFWAV